MRTLIAIAALALCPPAGAARAQDDGGEETTQPPPIDPTPAAGSAVLDFRVSAPWTLDDGVGVDEVPWDDFDSGASYTPRGPFHLGLSARAGALTGRPDPLPDGPLFELGLVGDVRFARDRPWHLRVVLAVALQPYVDEHLGGGLSRMSSPLAVKVRAFLFALDLGNWGALRVGPEVGAQWAPRPSTDGAVEAYFGGTAEAMLRPLDGHLEIGVFGGAQLTSLGQLGRPNAYRSAYVAEAVWGLAAGAVLP